MHLYALKSSNCICFLMYEQHIEKCLCYTDLGLVCDGGWILRNQALKLLVSYPYNMLFLTL